MRGASFTWRVHLEEDLQLVCCGKEGSRGSRGQVGRRGARLPPMAGSGDPLTLALFPASHLPPCCQSSPSLEKKSIKKCWHLD